MSTVKDSETEMLPRSSVQSSFLQSCIYVLHCLTCLAIIPNQWSILIIDDSDCKLSAIIFLSINALHITQTYFLFLRSSPYFDQVWKEQSKYLSKVSYDKCGSMWHLLKRELIRKCGVVPTCYAARVGRGKLLWVCVSWLPGSHCLARRHNGAVTAPGNQLASTQVLWQMPTLLSRTSCFSLHSLRYWNIK